jgi:tubulin polyglutamylase TTLL1
MLNKESEAKNEGGNNQSGKQHVKLKYRTDMDKAVLTQNFEKRGWQRTNGEDDWNIFWALPWSVKQIFNPDTGHRLGELQ